MCKYLTKKDIIGFNKATEGKGKVMKEGPLDSAVKDPPRMFSGVELNPTIPEKTFALACPIAQNHPFGDGNKRTAYKAVNEFLKLNGCEIPGKSQEVLFKLIGSLAAKEPIEREDFVKIIKSVIKKKRRIARANPFDL